MKDKVRRNWVNKIVALLFLSLTVTGASTFYSNALAQPAPAKDATATKSTSAKTTSTKTTEATPAPSDKEIADAKAKGLVWVNLSSGVYHKEGKFYGKTKRGKFLSEDDAKKAGYHEAKTATASKTKSKPAPTTKN
jgi:hypothetical protein